MKWTLEVLALVLVVRVEGYNEDSGLDKWSPSYFNYRYFPQHNFIKRRRELPEFVEISSPQVNTPSLFVGSPDTLYRKRTSVLDSWAPGSSSSSATGRESCAVTGGVCLWRGALIGAAIKINCCNMEDKCVFKGRSFTCVDKREIDAARQDLEEEDKYST